ncbi:MAG: hypothetical protein ACYC2T_13825 [Bacillota bacterium]
MHRLRVLVTGEFDRLKKYNLFTANFVVLLFWVGLAWFFEERELKAFIPFVFLMDSTMMTILLVGATLFYEKKEHTMNSIAVSPVTEDEYLYSKVIVTVLNSLITVIIVSTAVFFINKVTLNYLQLIPAVIMVTVVHALIGIRLSYYAKNFTSLLVNYIIYVFLFLFPSVLAMLGIIGADAAKYLIILPPEASNILISASVREVEAWRIIIGYLYLGVLSLVLYRFLIKPGFNEYVMRETGV